MKRVMIIGQPGSGKSTLARALGAATGLPVVHIDLIHWQSGWVERDNAEKDRMCAEVHAREAWIFEGGRSPTWPERLARADTLIWLDIPLRIRAWRVVKRRIMYHGKTRPDLPKDCPERFDWEFTRYIWNTRKTARDKMRRVYESAPRDKAKHHLRSNRAVRAYLDEVAGRYQPSG